MSWARPTGHPTGVAIVYVQRKIASEIVGHEIQEVAPVLDLVTFCCNGLGQHLLSDPFDVRETQACKAQRLHGVGVARSARSEEHTSELPSLMRTSYAVFCL